MTLTVIRLCSIPGSRSYFFDFIWCFYADAPLLFSLHFHFFTSIKFFFLFLFNHWSFSRPSQIRALFKCSIRCGNNSTRRRRSQSILLILLRSLSHTIIIELFHTFLHINILIILTLNHIKDNFLIRQLLRRSCCCIWIKIKDLLQELSAPFNFHLHMICFYFFNANLVLINRRVISTCCLNIWHLILLLFHSNIVIKRIIDITISTLWSGSSSNNFTLRRRCFRCLLQVKQIPSFLQLADFVVFLFSLIRSCLRFFRFLLLPSDNLFLVIFLIKDSKKYRNIIVFILRLNSATLR